jgi:peptidoglycan/LPS O-acetylase OafA/YrhL
VRKLDFVDQMRGLAILLVIAVHYSQVFAQVAIRNLGLPGQLGVQLFFIASAFTLCRSADSRRDEAHPVRNFYLRRYFRIAPLYYLGIVLYTAIFWADARGAFYTPVNIAANVLFVHGLVPAANNTIVPGGWTIGAEMLFYLIFPWLYGAIEAAWRRWGNRALLAAVGVSLAVMLGWHFGWHAVQGRWIGNTDFGYSALPGQLPVFVLGIAYYLWAWRGGAFAPRPWRDALAALALLAVCAWILVWRQRPLLGVVSTIAGIAAVFAANWLRGLARPSGWLGAVGKVSYSLYIIHFALVWRPSAWLVMAIKDPAVAWAIAGPLYVLEVWLLYQVAGLTLRWIETPANTLGRRWINRLEQPEKVQFPA